MVVARAPDKVTLTPIGPNIKDQVYILVVICIQLHRPKFFPLVTLESLSIQSDSIIVWQCCKASLVALASGVAFCKLGMLVATMCCFRETDAVTAQHLIRQFNPTWIEPVYDLPSQRSSRTNPCIS